MASPNSTDARLAVALEALTTIETTARRNAEVLLSIARIAHAALDQIRALPEAELTSEESEYLYRDTEGLGNPL